ncbi:MAG TPA: alpha-amylase family glycosyl hydrolase [Bacteroidales bacterium]|nr:alpha-amylase family glycosyl hydrolase [Bacteroidales bacterium]
MRRKIIFFLALTLTLFATGSSCNPTVNPDMQEFKEVMAYPPQWDGTKRGDITYQLLVYSFADSDGDGWGDLRGITEKLDYIQSLGASAIWLSPIHPSASYHGYDVEAYGVINPRFGTMADFKQLVSEAHKRNIHIYLDYVINHSGVNHIWFKIATSSMKNTYRDYYIFSNDPQKDIAAGKIPMIATEGAGGYDSGQWFSTGTMPSGIYKFTLNWSNGNAPTVTISSGGTPDKDNPDQTTEGAKYLYYGDGICKKFYSKGNGVYELTVDFNSSWGFLIRTSNSSSWPLGTKYGAKKGTSGQLSFDVPFTLYTDNSSNDNILNLTLPGGNIYYYHSHFWTDWFADLNYGPVATAEFSLAFKEIVAIAQGWINTGVDGFRLDAVKHIYHNENSDENPQFLKKFYDIVNTHFKAKNGRDIYMVGEVFSDWDKVAPYYKGLPALFDFSFWWRMNAAINQGQGLGFADATITIHKAYSNQRSDFIAATKLSNHDENRTRSELGGSLAKAKLAGAMLLSSQGSPYIYYGEELGYTGTKTGGDEYVRTPMYWGDRYVTSYTDKIDPAVGSTVGSVVSQEADASSILTMYRQLGRLRNSCPALATGKMERHPVINPQTGGIYSQVAAWYMIEGKQKLLVLHNLGQGEITLSLSESLTKPLFANGLVQTKKVKENFQLKMEGYSSVIFEL